jgi:hypothetical protein
MTGFRVGVADPILVARPTADTFTRANYLGAVANRVDSFWVPDHLNQLFPRSLWKQKYCGATKLIPRVDAVMEPWTMLGHIGFHAAHWADTDAIEWLPDIGLGARKTQQALAGPWRAVFDDRVGEYAPELVASGAPVAELLDALGDQLAAVREAMA